MRPKLKPYYSVFFLRNWMSEYKTKTLALRAANKFGEGAIISFGYRKYKGKDWVGSEVNARQYDHTGKKYWDKRINAQLRALEKKHQNIEKRMRCEKRSAM